MNLFEEMARFWPWLQTLLAKSVGWGERLRRWLTRMAAAPRWGKGLSALACCCLLLLIQPGGSAAAAERDPDLPLATPVKPQPDASDIPSERVSKFVQAYLAVVDLIGQRETDLQRAETETESI
ncbi:MAG: hypothetical protein ICV62_05025, partial [Cyanobacteria bacterium Co-bin13]|nr:hypothetical protein [Cyanobacteria bacterium Co-bin13]